MDSESLFGKVSATICDILAQHCGKCIEFDKEITIFGMISVTVDKSNNREPREYLLKVSRTLEKAAPAAERAQTQPRRSANGEAFAASENVLKAQNGLGERTGKQETAKAVPLVAPSMMANLLGKSMQPEALGAHELLAPFAFSPLDTKPGATGLQSMENLTNGMLAAARGGLAAPMGDGGALASRFMALEMLAALEMRRAAQNGPLQLEKLQRAAWQQAERDARLSTSGASTCGVNGVQNGLFWSAYEPGAGAGKTGETYAARGSLLTPMALDGQGPLGALGAFAVKSSEQRALGPYGDLGCMDETHALDKSAPGSAQMKVITDLKQDRRALRHDPQTAEVFSWIRTMADTSDTACQICGKQFTNKWSLRRHLLQHTGYKPYLCVLCNRSFYRRDHFSSHMIAWHKNDPNRCAATNSALGQAENVLCSAEPHAFAMENLVGPFPHDKASPDSQSAPRLSPFSVTRTDSSDDTMLDAAASANGHQMLVAATAGAETASDRQREDDANQLAQDAHCERKRVRLRASRTLLADAPSHDQIARASPKIANEHKNDCL